MTLASRALFSALVVFGLGVSANAAGSRWMHTGGEAFQSLEVMQNSGVVSRIVNSGDATRNADIAARVQSIVKAEVRTEVTTLGKILIVDLQNGSGETQYLFHGAENSNTLALATTDVVGTASVTREGVKISELNATLGSTLGDNLSVIFTFILDPPQPPMPTFN